MIAKQAKNWTDEKLERLLGMARAELAQMKNGTRKDGDCVQHESVLLSVISKLEAIKNTRRNGVS